MMEVELMAHNPGLLDDNFLSCKLSPTPREVQDTRCIMLSLAPTFDERLAGVFSFYEAIPVIDEYLSSIQIDDDNPGFVLHWISTNVAAFVKVANNQPAVNAPWWMRTLPPNVTADTFTDDLVSELARVAGGRCGRLMLAPNTLAQFCAVAMILAHIQANAFMQNVGQIALPVINGVERHLATTYSLTDTKAQRSTLNTLPGQVYVYSSDLITSKI